MGVDYLMRYITNQDSLLRVKDPHAIRIRSAYGNQKSVHNYKFSDKELQSIIAYLQHTAG